ncbi:unnamed protein product [Paramecium pentaurelia]|uniref:VPS9 domain-containing protein n=1 Tax=Paramecium pentaurelia TaxID=43138 RepID=A0A8S1V4L1_9CILI|nr:unnamed protein product [Paramecium pentaurelia]
MGNHNSFYSENLQEIYKMQMMQWYVGVEKEVQKLGFNVNVRSDHFHKQNFMQLYTIVKPQHEEIVTMSTTESLFATEFENIKRSKKTLDPFKEFYVTTLIQDNDPSLQEFERQVLQQLSTLNGCLLEIFQTFRQTQLPNCSKELDQFIVMFRDSFVQILIHYYDLNLFASLNKCNFLNTSSLQCLVSNMIFNDQVASHVYQIKKLEQIQENEKIHNKLQFLKEKTLADFGISIKYCLDCTTREYIQSKLSSKANTCCQSQQITKKDTFETLIIEDVDSTQLPSRPQAKLLQGTFFLQSPFQNAIEALKLIQFRQTPHHKVKQLVACFRSIYSAIIDYYNQYTKQPSIISTDEMIPIFHYVLCKSSLQNPYTHFEIMQKYLGNLDGLEGFYLAIMEAVFNIV